MNVYLDSSIALRRLRRTAAPVPHWGDWEHAYASVLLRLEVLRTIDRLRLQGTAGGSASGRPHYRRARDLRRDRFRSLERPHPPAGGTIVSHRIGNHRCASSFDRAVVGRSWRSSVDAVSYTHLRAHET